MFKVNNKDICYSVSIVTFEQVNADQLKNLLKN